MAKSCPLLTGPVSGNHFDVEFISDDNRNGAGFYATYDVYTNGLTPPPPLAEAGEVTGK